MKKILFITFITLISTMYSYGQKDTDVIRVPRLDSSPFDFKIVHLWTGKTNRIYIDDNILKIWSDNGSIDTGSYYLTRYSIKPIKNGKVNIHSLLKIVKNKNIVDTIETLTSFTSITQPNIIANINKKLLIDSLIIRYSIEFADSGKPIKESSYRLGAFPLPFVVYNDSAEIGKIFIFTDEKESKELLNKGNKLRIPSFLIRDNKTDLTFGTPEYDYNYK